MTDHGPYWIGTVHSCRQCAWNAGTKAIEARREARREISLANEEHRWPAPKDLGGGYWQLTPPPPVPLWRRLAHWITRQR
jgi:hypothetical protein